MQEIDAILKKNDQDHDQLRQEISGNKLQILQNQESTDLQIQDVHHNHDTLRGFCDSLNNEVKYLWKC